METAGRGLGTNDENGPHSHLPGLGAAVTKTHTLGELIRAGAGSGAGPHTLQPRGSGGGGETIGESGGPGVKSRAGACVM